MHRHLLKNLLEQYAPPSAKEEETKKSMLGFLVTHPDCFDRSCVSGHFTGSAWLLNRPKTHALLMHHRKLDKWLQLGGHCDGESDVLAVALKEAQEESGINGIIPISTTIFDIDLHEIPPYKETPAHKHYDIRFLLHVHTDEDFIKNEESNQLMWVPKHVSPHFPFGDESVKRLHQKWIEIGN